MLASTLSPLHLLLLFTSPILATTTPTLKKCTDYKVTLPTITSQNFLFDPAQKFKNDYDLTDFIVQAAARTAEADFHPFVGVQNQTESYWLSGTFCMPKVATGKGREKTVLVATHGLNFNRGYVHLYTLIFTLFNLLCIIRLLLGFEEELDGKD